MVILPLVTPSIEPSPSSPGIQGCGEGIKYGQGTRPRTYYYRFAGKKIPRDKVAYVTAEDNYFSRVSGERHQLIVAYDTQANGFRVLDSLSPNSGRFKETFQLYQNKTPEQAIEFANNQAIENKKVADRLKAELENNDDLF